MKPRIAVRIPVDLYDEIRQVLELKYGGANKSAFRTFVLECLNNESNFDLGLDFQIISWSNAIRKDISIPEQLKTKLEQLALEKGTSVTALVISALRNCVKKYIGANRAKSNDSIDFFTLVDQDQYLRVWTRLAMDLKSTNKLIVHEDELKTKLVEIIGMQSESKLKKYIDVFYDYRVIDIRKELSHDENQVIRTRTITSQTGESKVIRERVSKGRVFEVILPEVHPPEVVPALIQKLKLLFEYREQLVEALKKRDLSNLPEDVVSVLESAAPFIKALIRSYKNQYLIAERHVLEIITYFFKKACAIIRIAKKLRYDVKRYETMLSNFVRNEIPKDYGAYLMQIAHDYGLAI